ncbi:unnamed protein product [Zymoseptoria tritici ST99CH_3D1]|nr:unnamed protein product [Zymoseptoria tritici ST99CH_3D1]
MKARLDRVWSKKLDSDQQESLADVVREWQRAAEAVVSAKELVDEHFAADVNTPNLEDQHDALQAWQQAVEDVLPTLQILKDHMSALDKRHDIRNSGCNGHIDMWMKDFNAQLQNIKATVNAMAEPDHAVLAKRKEAKRIAQGNLGLGWVGPWAVGKGSFGAATLHVKQNAYGRIIDRLVMKDTIFQGRTADHWNRKELWTGNDGGPEDLNSIPIEIQAMKDLRNKTGSGSVVELRNWKLSRKNRSHRLYLEYCPHDDMFELLNVRTYLIDSMKRKQTPDIVIPNAALYPEPFAWYTFWTLAIAGILMERGALTKDGPAHSNWSTIVHRDIKLSNVFLGPASTTHFCCYPEPKLGDFGFSILLSPEDTRTAESFNRSGTPNTRAPEQDQLLFTRRGRMKKLSSKTNVFGIGMTIWSLIRQQEGFDMESTDWSDPNKLELKPELDATARNFYSKDLINLIDRCVEFNDEDRPTMDELLCEIDSFTGGDGPVDHAKGLRFAAADDRIWKDYKLPPSYDTGKFVLGLPLNYNPFPRSKTSFPAAPPRRSNKGPRLMDDLGGPEGTDYILPPSERVLRSSATNADSKATESRQNLKAESEEKSEDVPETADAACGARKSKSSSKEQSKADSPSPSKRRKT